MFINIDILYIEVIVCLIADLIPVKGDWTRIRDYEYPDIPFLLTWKGQSPKRLDQPRRNPFISTTSRTAAAAAAAPVPGNDFNNVDRMTKLRPWLSPKFNEAPYEENTSRSSAVSVAETSAKPKKKHKLGPKSKDVFENKDELQSKEESERFVIELNEHNSGEGNNPGEYYEDKKKNIPLNTEGYVTCYHPEPPKVDENVEAPPVTEGEVNSAKSSIDPPSQGIENAIIKSKGNLNYMLSEKPIDIGPSMDYAVKTSGKNGASYSGPLTDERKFRDGYQDAPQELNIQSERNSKQREREFPDLKMSKHARHKEHRPLGHRGLSLDYDMEKGVGTVRGVHRAQSLESEAGLAKTSTDEEVVDPHGHQFKFGKNTRNIADTAGGTHKEYTAIVDMKNEANPSYRDENLSYYSNSADRDPEILVGDDLHRTNTKYNRKLHNEDNSLNRKENLQVAKTRGMKNVSPEMLQNETQDTFLENSGEPALSQNGVFDAENKIDRYKPVKEVSYSLSGRYYANSVYNQNMSRDGTNWNPSDRMRGEVTSQQPMKGGSVYSVRGEPSNERPVVHDKYQLSQKKMEEGGGGGLLARPPIKAPPFVDRDPNSEKNPINTENTKKEKGPGKKSLLQGIRGAGDRGLQMNPLGHFAQRISFEEIVQARPRTGEYIQNQTQEVRYYLPQSPPQPYSNETSRNYLDPAVYLNTIENEQSKSRESSVLAEKDRLQDKDTVIDKKPLPVERNENEMPERRQMVASDSYVYNNTGENEPFLGSNLSGGNFSVPSEYNQQSEQNLELGRNESERINEQKLIYRTLLPTFQLPVDVAPKDAATVSHVNYTNKMENEKLNEQQIIPVNLKVNQIITKENTSRSKYLQNEMFKNQNNNINKNQPNKINLILNDPHVGTLDETTVRGLNKMDTSVEQFIPVNMKTNQNMINENTSSSKYLQNEMFKNQNNNNQPNKINFILNDHHMETFNEKSAKGLDKMNTSVQKNGNFLQKNYILSDSTKNVGNIPINRNKILFENVPNEKNVTNEYKRKDILDENIESKTYIPGNYQINDKRLNESVINEIFIQNVNKINTSDFTRSPSNGNNKGYNLTQSEHNGIRGAASNESYTLNGMNKTNYRKEDKTNIKNSYDSEERESDFKDSEEAEDRDSEKVDSRRENTEDSDVSREDKESIRYEKIEGSKAEEEDVVPVENPASRIHKMTKKWVKKDDFTDKNDDILHEGVHNEEMGSRNSAYYSLSKTEEPSRISALLGRVKETAKQKKKYKHLKRDYDYKNNGKNANESGNTNTDYYEDDYDDYEDLEDYRGGASSTALPAQRTQGQDKPRGVVSGTRAGLQAHRAQTNSYRENGVDSSRADPFLHPLDINDPELELVISSNADSNNKLHQLDSDDSDLPEKKTEVSFRMKLNDELSEQEMSLMRDHPVLSKPSSEGKKKHSRNIGNK